MTEPTPAPPTPPSDGVPEFLISADEELLREAVRALFERRLPVPATLRWQPSPPEGRRPGARRGPYPRRLEIPRGRGVELYLPVERIDWIEAANQYARVHAREESYLVRRSLRRLEELLDPGRFPRVHRSAIVNVERVREIRTESPTRRSAILAGGRRIPISDRHLEDLRAALTGTV